MQVLPENKLVLASSAVLRPGASCSLHQFVCEGKVDSRHLTTELLLQSLNLIDFNVLVYQKKQLGFPGPCMLVRCARIIT